MSATQPTYRVTRKLADGSVKVYRYTRAAKRRTEAATGSLGAMIAAYRASPEWRDLKPRTASQYMTYLAVLESPMLLAQPASALKRGAILALRDSVAAGRGSQAANVFVRVASALFAWGLGREVVEANPAARIKRLPGGHLPAWSDADYAHAVAHLIEPLRRAVVLGRYTGQRRGDLIAMRWSQYDGKRITVAQEKRRNGSNNQPLRIPAPAALRGELDRWRVGVAEDSHILLTPLGRPWIDTYLSRLLGEALAAIGMPHKNVHGLRKLAAASLAEAGASTHEIAAVTGHSTLAMIELYTRSAQQGRLADAAMHKLEAPARNAARKMRNAKKT